MLGLQPASSPLVEPPKNSDNGNVLGAPAVSQDKVASPPAADRMQASRYEYKYVLSEEKAARARELVKQYLVPDEFTVGKEGRGYFVHSLYLDSPDFKTYYETEQGSRNRYKIRIRFYDDNPKSACFLEVKRRDGERIIKTRAMVTKQAAEHFCNTGLLPCEADLIKPTASHIKGLQTFNRFCTLLDARPSTLVSYLREGYEGAFDNRERITFDRDLRGAPYKGKLSVADRESWVCPPMEGVVFEMKFTDEPPPWMIELARLLNLDRTSFKKYILCAVGTHPELDTF